jgi:curved DNA-binding protein CbpA
VLGLAPGASDAAVARAFRRLALVHHPDKNVGQSPQARSAFTKKFHEISRAYELLKDRDKRDKYDKKFDMRAVSDSTLRVRVHRQRLTQLERKCAAAIDVARKKLVTEKKFEGKKSKKEIKQPVKPRRETMRKSTSEASKVIPPGKKWILFTRRKSERKADRRMSKFVALPEYFFVQCRTSLGIWPKIETCCFLYSVYIPYSVYNTCLNFSFR